MRGRKPTPSAVRAVEGTRSHTLRKNRDEPIHESIEAGADVPEELTDPRAIEEWRRVIDSLSRGHITIVDRGALVGYCAVWARWRALEDLAASQPLTSYTRTGYQVPNPVIGMANKALLLMMKIAAELGITPSSRTRVHKVDAAAPPGTPVDEFTAWQRKRRKGSI
jgi:P27 family predicted phage terminase small subunit